jgi:hypothetical protein
MTTTAAGLSQMSEHILEADYKAATRDFCTLLRDGAEPMRLGLDALSVASPFLNVPAHIMIKADGEQRSVNFDHVVLGMWRSARMSQFMPRGYELLPVTQGMWYLPQGLDVWSQLLCEFPGHYAREQEKCPEINLRGPHQYFDALDPVADGSFEDRLEAMLSAIIQGDRAVAFSNFRSLADEATTDPERRKQLEASVLFAAMSDLPGPRMLPPNIVNAAHKALRARAMIDLARVLGWENAGPIFLAVIPDLATAPRFSDLLEAATAYLTGHFGPAYRDACGANTGSLNAREIESFVAVLLHGTPEDTFEGVTALLGAGKSPVAINDAAVLAAARLMVTIERPGLSAGFSQLTHCFDYGNVVGYWLRSYNHPQRVKAAYYAPHFVNESARVVRRVAPNPDEEFTSQPHEHARFAEALTLDNVLLELSKAVDEQEAPLATALVDSYLHRSKDRKRLSRTLAFASAKWEGDPHMPRNAMSHEEEYTHSTNPEPYRDEIFRSWTRYVSRVRKRSYDFNCLDLYREVLQPDA